MLRHRVKRLEAKYGMDVRKLSDAELIERICADKELMRLLTDPDIQLPEVPDGVPIEKLSDMELVASLITRSMNNAET